MTDGDDSGYEPWWRTVTGGIGCGVLLTGIVIVTLILGFFAVTWGYHEWWVSIHCTTVLDTRVCQ